MRCIADDRNEFRLAGVDFQGLPIKRPYPWEKDVTVCIAAICEEHAEPKLVFCADKRVGTTLGGAQTALKIRYMRLGWECLVSGHESDINGLLRHYRPSMGHAVSISHENIDSIIRTPLLKRQRELAEEYTRHRFALSYDDFVQLGREKLPPDIHRDAVIAIKNLRLKAEFIIAGFSGGYPELYQTDEDGSLHFPTDFAVVGEGSYLAMSVLRHREQQNVSSFAATLYNLYEAKRYAERINSVGDQTSILVIDKNGRRDMMSEAGLSLLKSKFEEFGPRRMKEFDIPASVFGSVASKKNEANK